MGKRGGEGKFRGARPPKCFFLEPRLLNPNLINPRGRNYLKSDVMETVSLSRFCRQREMPALYESDCLTLYGHIKTAQQPLYIDTVIGTLAVDGWAVTFGRVKRSLGGLGPRPVPSSLYQM